MAEVGDFICYGSGRALVVADVSDPAAPQVVGDVALPGEVKSITVVDRLAYVAAGLAGLRVVDVSVRSDPREIGGADTPQAALDVAVENDHAYVAAGYYVRVFDVGSPTSPVEIAAHEVPISEVSGVAVAGSYAFATGYDYDLEIGRMEVVDMHDPSRPVPVGATSLGGAGEKVTIAGNYVYVAGSDARDFPAFGRLWVIDVTDPSAPSIVSGGYMGSALHDVAVSEGYAYLVGRLDQYTEAGRLAVFDVRDPVSIVTVATLDTTAIPLAVAASEGRAYVAAYSAGVRLVDTGDPSAPVETGVLATPDDTMAVAVDRGFAYVAVSRDLRIFDIAQQVAPVEEGLVEMPGRISKVAAGDGLAYVSVGHSLRIVDVSDPARAAELGFIEFDDYARPAAISGQLAYVADGDLHLHLIDVSSPAHPVEVAQFSSSRVRDVAANDGYAYAAAGEDGLWVFDTSNPTGDPVGHRPTPSSATVVELAGHLVFLSLGSAEVLDVLDISDPTHPYTRASFDTERPILAIAASDEIVVTLEGNSLTSESGILRVLDLRDPDSVVELAQRAATISTSDSMVLVGERLYVSAGPGGLEVLDLSGCIPRPPAPRRATGRRAP